MGKNRIRYRVPNVKHDGPKNLYVKKVELIELLKDNETNPNPF